MLYLGRVVCYDSSWIPCVSTLTIINDNSHIDRGQLPEEDLYLYIEFLNFAIPPCNVASLPMNMLASAGC